jgi:tetratricopeptide (TPR) repeat protein
MQVFTRDARPKEWALMRLHLVRALQLQGERAEGAESETLLSEAMQVDEQALQVFTRDAYPKDWAHIQQSLGITLGLLGQRVAGAESQRLLNESAQAYRRAMLVFTRDALPEHWARTQNNLGNTLRMQGTRAAGAEGQKLLDEAVQSFRQAMQVYAREAQHEGWKMAQTNLGLTLLSQWQQAEKAERRRLLDEAVQVYRLLLEDSPDNPTFFGTLHDLYGSLGDFDKEYTLLASWLARHPEDLSSHANFAEAQLLTGRFAESVQSLAAILRNPEQASRHLALRTLEVVALTALGNSRDVPARLQSLRAAISAQPTPLKIRWRFAEVKVFLERDARLAAQRDWLLKLIAAVEKPDQAACLKALGIVIVQQPRAPPG